MTTYMVINLQNQKQTLNSKPYQWQHTKDFSPYIRCTQWHGRDSDNVSNGHGNGLTKYSDVAEEDPIVDDRWGGGEDC